MRCASVAKKGIGGSCSPTVERHAVTDSGRNEWRGLKVPDGVRMVQQGEDAHLMTGPLAECCSDAADAQVSATDLVDAHFNIMNINSQRRPHCA